MMGFLEAESLGWTEGGGVGGVKSDSLASGLGTQVHGGASD